MTGKMFSQLCATVALAAVTVLIGRSMHDLATVILFAVGVLATILSAFRVRSLRVKHLAEVQRRVPQNAATDDERNPSSSKR
jgi:thiol:disulfide interchange protein